MGLLMKLMREKTVSDSNLGNTHVSLLKIYSVDREMRRHHNYAKKIFFKYISRKGEKK